VGAAGLVRWAGKRVGPAEKKKKTKGKLVGGLDKRKRGR
jgi:hypothetical protein